MDRASIATTAFIDLLTEGHLLLKSITFQGGRTVIECSTVELRKNLGEYLGKAHHGTATIRVRHHGRPYAAIVSEAEGEFLAKWNDLLERFNSVAHLKASPLTPDSRRDVHQKFYGLIRSIESRMNDLSP